jgi:hypothetical protein
VLIYRFARLRGFPDGEVSSVRAVAWRAFPLLLIGTAQMWCCRAGIRKKFCAQRPNRRNCGEGQERWSGPARNSGGECGAFLKSSGAVALGLILWLSPKWECGCREEIPARNRER